MGTQCIFIGAITTVMIQLKSAFIQLYAHIVTFFAIIYKGTELTTRNFFTLPNIIL